MITTASAQNHEFVKSLGAAGVMDYKSENAVDELVSLLDKEEVVGVYDAISEDASFGMIERVLGKLQLKVNVATVLPSGKDYALEERRGAFCSFYTSGFVVG